MQLLLWECQSLKKIWANQKLSQILTHRDAKSGFYGRYSTAFLNGLSKKKKTGQLFTFSRETGLTLLRIIISKRLLGKSTVLPLKKSKPMVQKPANTFYFQKHFYFSQNTSVCIKKIILINCIIILTPIWWNFF